MAEDAAALTALAEDWDQKIRAVRKTGDIAAILSEAQAAVAALEAAIGPRTKPGKGQISALKTLRKITYNSAADVYPGWEVNTPPRTPAQLGAAMALAQASQKLVEELAEDAEHQANAAWLVGALNLAQGKREAALSSFRSAADYFTQANATLMLGLAEGYIGIATGDVAAFDTAIAKIASLDEKYKDDIKEQLLVARQVYGPPSG